MNTITEIVLRSVLFLEANIATHTRTTYPCSEWQVNQHRDSFASYIGHPNLLEFFAIAENESKARVKFSFLQV